MSAGSPAAAKAAQRLELNLKNLRRHDPAINAIVGQSAYVGAYWNDGTGWVKANIEGPMFLFKRELSPVFGFFILNRNGLEYVNEFLVPESEVKLEGEFILFEPRPDADRATGIWVHDKSEREKLCAQMEGLRKMSVSPARTPASAPVAAAPAPPAPSQPISLDQLFARAAQPPQPQQTQPQQPQQQQYQQPAVQQNRFAPPTQPHPSELAPPQGQYHQPPPFAAQPPPQQHQQQPQQQPANLQHLMSQMMGGGLPFQPPQPQQQYSHQQPLFQHLSPQPQPQQAPAPAPAQPVSGLALLDSMFKSAKTPAPPSPAPVPQQAPVHAQRPLPVPVAAPGRGQQQQQQAVSPVPSFVGSPVGAGMAQARDAGALLAMMGLGSPTGPLPLGLPLMSPPPMQAKALPAANGHVSPAAPASAPAPAAAPAPTAAPVPAPASAAAAKPASPAAPSPVGSSGGRTPVFAAPLLSHNLFSLPLPGQKKKAPEPEQEPVSLPEPQPEQEEAVEEAVIVEAVVVDVPLTAAEVVEAPAAELAQLGLNGNGHESAPAPAFDAEPISAPVPEVKTPVESTSVLPDLAALASPSLLQSPAFRGSPALGRPGASSRASSVSIGLGGAGGAEMPAKDVVLAMLDEEVRRARVGMEGQVVEGEDGEEEEREPLDKSVFIRGVRELLAKPGFSTALYARYLRAFSEELE